jgi:vitamin K-dependent gamma-carboxylase
LIGIPYFFGGIAKLGPDWLQGEPMRMWLAERSHLPVIGPHVHGELMVYFFAWGGVTFDLLVVPCFLWKPTRIPACIAAVSFHLLNTMLFQMGIFPWLMLAATLIFFPQDLFRRALTFLGFLPRTPVVLELAPTAPRRQRVILVLLSVFLGVQVLLPFRHLLFPATCTGLSRDIASRGT